MLILPFVTGYSLKRRGKKLLNASSGYEVVSSFLSRIITK